MRMHLLIFSTQLRGCTALESLTRPNACSCSGPHNQAHLVLSSSRNGWVSSEICGENFPNWLTMPRNLLRSNTDWGVSMSRIALVFSGSALTPSWPCNQVPQKLHWGLPEGTLFSIDCYSNTFQSPRLTSVLCCVMPHLCLWPAHHQLGKRLLPRPQGLHSFSFEIVQERWRCQWVVC